MKNKKLPPDPREHYITTPIKIGLRPLAKLYNTPQQPLFERCRKEGWVEQRKQFQNKAIARSREKAIEKLSEMNTRLLTYGKFLEAKGITALRGDKETNVKPLSITNVSDAIKAIAEGVKIELLARELPTERIETKASLDKYTIKEILRSGG